MERSTKRPKSGFFKIWKALNFGLYSAAGELKKEVYRTGVTKSKNEVKLLKI
jgi:hypothetical protein